MVSIKNELVFMEMDTLVMIAKEAVESSEPRHNSSEAQDQAPVALDTRGRKKPLQTRQLKNQRLIGLLNHEACEMVHKPDTDNNALLFEIMSGRVVSGDTPGTHVHGGTRQRRQRKM